MALLQHIVLFEWLFLLPLSLLLLSGFLPESFTFFHLFQIRHLPRLALIVLLKAWKMKTFTALGLNPMSQWSQPFTPFTGTIMMGVCSLINTTIALCMDIVDILWASDNIFCVCVFIYRNVKSRESSSESAVINRLEYMKSTDTTAWVTAKNVLGSAQSERFFFNTGHISKSCLLYCKPSLAFFKPCTILSQFIGSIWSTV